jgi:hypothetical protein
MTMQNPVYMPNELIFNFLKSYVSLMCLQFLKIISPKTFGPHWVYYSRIKIYNNLPLMIKHLYHDTNKFKLALKSFF